MRKMSRFILSVLTACLLVLNLSNPVKAEELPGYYQEVIDYLSAHYDEILDRQISDLDPKYVSHTFLGQGPADHLAYALYDLDGNGVPELFVGPGNARAIYTYANDDVHLIADYATGYLTNRGNIDFYENGKMYGSMSGGALHGVTYELFFNDDKTELIKGKEYTHDFMDYPDQPYEDVETGERMTEDEFRDLKDEGPKLDPSSWEWTPIKPGAVQASETEEEDDAVGHVEDEELKAYLGDLHQANERWLEGLRELTAGELPTSDEIASFDFSVQGVHPAITALYNQFEASFADYQEDIEAAVMMREIYSDTFVLEKMLLPEFDQEDHQALDQLREWLVSLVDEAYEIRSHEGLVQTEWAHEYLDFVEYLEDAQAMSDEIFDESNRIAMHTGVASEAYGTLVNHEAHQSETPQGRNLFSHSINPWIADVGSGRLHVYILEDDEVLQSIPGTGPGLEPFPSLDYQTRYGITIDNHYPAASLSQTVSPQARTSGDDQWTQEKAEALKTGIHSWGLTMGQSYQEYTPSDPVDFYGGTLPQDTFDLYVDGQVRQAEYRAEGNNHDLLVLAVYSDIEDNENPSDERHLYLFVQDQGHPRVLITMAGPDEEGILSFKDTANEDLYQLFAELQ